MGRDNLNGRTILQWLFRKWDVRGMDWIDLAQDRDSLVSHEGLCFTE